MLETLSERGGDTDPPVEDDVDEESETAVDVRKDLITLPADELFRIAKVIGPIRGKDLAELDMEDSEVCFEYINAFMLSKSLLETEDQGQYELRVAGNVPPANHPLAGNSLALLSTVCGRRATGLHPLFHLWRGWTPGGGVPQPASATGKRESATAKGQPVTVKQMPQPHIIPPKPARPREREVIGQANNRLRQTHKTMNELGSRSQGASVLGPCKNKTDNIIKLIGSKALTQCNLNGLTVRALLDTGAQVSMVDREWKDKYLPSVDVKPLRELLGWQDDLKVYAINGDLIPFDGWAVITVNLLGNEDPSLSINVPFLVSKMPIERPLLGFNLVEALIQGQSEQLMPTLTSLLAGAIDIPHEKAQTLVKVIQAAEEENGAGHLKIGPRGVVIRTGQVAW
ncbi:hypothetical protein DPEC_G00044660 [Dallia pectoralis]|uniref:Uncharacterized protein n=1 Tax=Dallia pectoralis TaxID=75939 RepID=A0ACC2H9E3_DALPE|nr:hypothetical protein DPEC_G00044660 [Dallia pectoralis]